MVIAVAHRRERMIGMTNLALQVDRKRLKRAEAEANGAGVQVAFLLVKAAHRAAGGRRNRERLQKTNLAAGIGEAGIGAEPVAETVVQVG